MKIRPALVKRLAGELEIKFPGIHFACQLDSPSEKLLSASSVRAPAVCLYQKKEKSNCDLR